jgi:hypothetical protein
MANKRKTLVVDTSVARAVSTEEPVDPNARCCLEVLNIIKNRYQIAMSKELRNEWRNYEGNRAAYGLRWLIEMERHELVVEFEDTADQKLRDDILKTTRQVSRHRAMQKDFLLLEAALAADKTIISRDKKCRRYFQDAAVLVERIKNIVWTNPDLLEDQVIEWLQNGAPAEEKYQLGGECGVKE